MREVQFFSHLTPQTLKSQKGARARARGPIRQARKSQRGPPEGKSVASDFLLWPPASILLIFPVQRLRGFIWELISLSWPYTFFFPWWCTGRCSHAQRGADRSNSDNNASSTALAGALFSSWGWR
jgi:hypothetical protein